MKNFKELLTKLDVSQQDFAQDVGVTYGSFRTMTTKKKLSESSPSWIRAFLFGLKLGKQQKGGNGEAVKDI